MLKFKSTKPDLIRCGDIPASKWAHGIGFLFLLLPSRVWKLCLSTGHSTWMILVAVWPCESSGEWKLEWNSQIDDSKFKGHWDKSEYQWVVLWCEKVTMGNFLAEIASNQDFQLGLIIFWWAKKWLTNHTWQVKKVVFGAGWWWWFGWQYVCGWVHPCGFLHWELLDWRIRSVWRKLRYFELFLLWLSQCSSWKKVEFCKLSLWLLISSKPEQLLGVTG